jgi:hypothetical protein
MRLLVLYNLGMENQTKVCASATIDPETGVALSCMSYESPSSGTETLTDRQVDELKVFQSIVMPSTEDGRYELQSEPILQTALNDEDRKFISLIATATSSEVSLVPELASQVMGRVAGEQTLTLVAASIELGLGVCGRCDPELRAACLTNVRAIIVHKNN